MALKLWISNFIFLFLRCQYCLLIVKFSYNSRREMILPFRNKLWTGRFLAICGDFCASDKCLFLHQNRIATAPDML